MSGLDIWNLFDQIGYDPHPGQQKIIESGARHRVVSAGRRFGKSDIGGHELVPEALLTKGLQTTLESDGKRREFWIVGPEYSDAEKEFRVAYNILKKLEVPFDRPGTYNDPIGGNMHISLWGGTFQVHAKSAKYPDTLVGEGLHGVILSEAAKLKQRVWIKHIKPTLADFNGWSLHTSTPEGRNWFYENWQRGQDPTKKEWASWRMPAWRNPYVYARPVHIPAEEWSRLSKAEKLERAVNTSDRDVKKLQFMMRKRMRMSVDEVISRYNLQIDAETASNLDDMTEESFNQEIAADFTEFVGRVFKDFDEEVHVGDLKYNPGWQTFAAADYGFTNPNVWLLIQVGPWGEVNVLGEYYRAGETADEFARNVQRAGLCPSNLITFYPDPASPGDTRIIENILKVSHTGGTGGELKDRIDGIRKGLKFKHSNLPEDHEANRPWIMFDRSCTNCIREFQAYKYPEKKDESSTKQQELPMKKDDHTPEALGRFWAGFFLTPQRQAQRTRVRKARITIGR